MFEHKNLDGNVHRIIPSTDSFLNGDVLEIREGLNNSTAENVTRMQYSVAGERLVERSLPPQSIGEFWTHDVPQTPWWSIVNNPPHAGLVADFNSHLGGKQRVPLDPKHNVVALSASGDEILFDGKEYYLKRSEDGKEFKETSILALRQAYYA